MMTVAKVKDCVDVIKGDELSFDSVQCEKLKARYVHLYASFYVKLHVHSSDMKHVLALFIYCVTTCSKEIEAIQLHEHFTSAHPPI